MNNAIYIQDLHQKLFEKYRLLPGRKNHTRQQFYSFLAGNSADLQLFLSANCTFQPVVISGTVLNYLKHD